MGGIQLQPYNEFMILELPVMIPDYFSQTATASLKVSIM